jgi:hypothetical protein
MVDSFVLWAPLVLLVVVALLGFVGCDVILGLGNTTLDAFAFKQLAETQETGMGDTIFAQLADADPSFAVVAGDWVLVWIWYDGVDAQGQIIQPPPSVKSVVDSAGNLYQSALLAPTDGAGKLAGYRQEIWVAENVPNGGQNLQVTATFTAPFAGVKAIVPHAYSAQPNVGVQFDKSLGQSGTGTAVSAGPLVISARSYFVFGAAVFSTSGTPGAGFSVRSTLGENVTEDEHLPSGNPGQLVSATFTALNNDDGTAPDWIAQIVTIAT